MKSKAARGKGEQHAGREELSAAGQDGRSCKTQGLAAGREALSTAGRRGRSCEHLEGGEAVSSNRGREEQPTPGSGKNCKPHAGGTREALSIARRREEPTAGDRRLVNTRGTGGSNSSSVGQRTGEQHSAVRDGRHCISQAREWRENRRQPCVAERPFTSR